MESYELSDKVNALMSQAKKEASKLPFDKVVGKVSQAHDLLITASGFSRMGDDYQTAREIYNQFYYEIDQIILERQEMLPSNLDNLRAPQFR